MPLSIITDHKPRHMLCLEDLSAKERADFDYIGEDDAPGANFIRYREAVYHLNEFLAVPRGADEMKGWDGYQSDSYFSGVLVRYVDGGDAVIIGRFYS